MSAFVPFTGQQKPASCLPYICPGAYVPASVPFEILEKLMKMAEVKMKEEDIRELRILGWNFKALVPPPVTWAAQKRAEAYQYMKTRAEYVSRTYFSTAPGAYRPWTADPICAICDRWTWGWGGDRGWTWKGVHSLRAKLPYPVPAAWNRGPGSGDTSPGADIITCGMLRDSGLISTAQECFEEDQQAVEAYRDMLVHEAKKMANANMVGHIVGMVFMAVFALVITIATWGAATPIVVAGALTSSLMTLGYAVASTGGKLSIQQIGTALAEMLASIATLGVSPIITTTLKMVVEVSIEAYTLTQKMAEQEEQKKELKEQRLKVEAETDELRKLITARASMEEIQAKVRELKAQVDEGERQLGQRLGSVVIVGGIGLAIAALVLTTPKRKS